MLLGSGCSRGCARQVLRALKAAARGDGSRKGEDAVRIDPGSQSLSQKEGRGQ